MANQKTTGREVVVHGDVEIDWNLTHLRGIIRNIPLIVEKAGCAILKLKP